MDSGRTDAMKYTNLCARLEAPAVLDSFIDPQSARAAMLEAAAVIRELEARAAGWEEMARDNAHKGASIGNQLIARAEAAEAKVAELTAEMNDWRNGDLRGVVAHLEAFKAKAEAAEAAAAIQHLLKANNELEAQVRESAMQELASLGQAQEAYEAQLAAEARVAELEAERSHWMNEARRTLKAGQDALERAEAAEAKVAELTRERDAVEALVNAAAQDAREVFEGCGSKAREAIDYMEQVALAAIRKGATP